MGASKSMHSSLGRTPGPDDCQGFYIDTDITVKTLNQIMDEFPATYYLTRETLEV
jgi:hypothetical protein